MRCSPPDLASGVILYGLAGLCSGGSYTPGLTLDRGALSARTPRAGHGILPCRRFPRLCAFHRSLEPPVSVRRVAPLLPGHMQHARCGADTLTVDITRHAQPYPCGTGHAGVWRGITAVVKNRAAFLSMLAYTFHNWELLGMWAWLPAYLAYGAQAAGGIVDRDAAVSGAVLLSGITYLTSMTGSLIGGSLSDRWGRSASMMIFSCMSLFFSFTFGWMPGMPLSVLFIAAALYNLAAIADSSVYSTALTELVEPSNIGAAYAVRSVMGYGAGVISPWVFGLVIDMASAEPFSSVPMGWGLAWTCLGLGALPGPIMIWFLRHHPKAVRMARGLR